MTGVDVEKPICVLKPESMNLPESNPTFQRYPSDVEVSDVTYTNPS
jgi:hypothetical protein